MTSGRLLTMWMVAVALCPTPAAFAAQGSAPVPELLDTVVTEYAGGDSAPRAAFLSSTTLYITGASTLAAVALMPADSEIRSWMQNERLQGSGTARGTAAVFRELGGPALPVASATLALAGRLLKKETLREVAQHSLEAVIAAAAVTGVVKVIAGRNRPWQSPDDQWDYELGRGFSDRSFRAFPSGHTAQAFAVAVTLSHEVRQRWPQRASVVVPLLYGSAALTGLSRIYHDRHWTSDVVMGAVFGTLAGKAVTVFNQRSSNVDLEVRPRLSVGGEGEIVAGLRVAVR